MNTLLAGIAALQTIEEKTVRLLQRVQEKAHLGGQMSGGDIRFVEEQINLINTITQRWLDEREDERRRRDECESFEDRQLWSDVKAGMRTYL